MKTYSLHEARAEFSRLIEQALAGEPCRVTRYGKEAVVVVSEADWRARPHSAPSLGALLARHSRAGALRGKATERPWKDRKVGIEIG